MMTRRGDDQDDNDGGDKDDNDGGDKDDHDGGDKDVDGMMIWRDDSEG